MKKTGEHMAFQTIDDITMDFYDENGTQKIKQVDKRILSRGSWTTIMFKYVEAQKEGGYGPEKISIRRYQKRNGEYKKQSHFNISSPKQAHLVVDSINQLMFGGKGEVSGSLDDDED